MKILIVEDDKFFQKFYSNKLKELSVEVDVADNGEEGLQKIKDWKPNLVLLDLVMPKMDGFGFLTERGKSEDLKKIPVIVFSTLGQEKDIEYAKKLGANDYINKGYFDFQSMLSVVNKVLST